MRPLNISRRWPIHPRKETDIINGRARVRADWSGTFYSKKIRNMREDVSGKRYLEFPQDDEDGKSEGLLESS